jgi:alkaline phosphatase D
MDRRAFLKASAFLTASALAPGVRADEDEAALQRDARESRPGRFVFDCGVASGDPRAFSVVFWTRVAPAAGGDEPVRVWLEVALDPRFRRRIWRERLAAHPEWDYTVRHKLAGLAPNRRYWYRFRAGGDVSAVGRTRTAPLPWDRHATQVKFGFLSCQDWSANHWQTIEHLAAEDIDFVVHLGDYIYEDVGLPVGPVEPAHPPLLLPDGAPTPNSPTTRHAVTLADYRYLYNTYRSDPRLQKLHAMHPVIAIWDDHEFTNDAWQEHQTYSNANLAEPERRRNANQAWFEYMPADVPFDAADPAFDNIRIYRDFEFGPLVHLVMTDERLYRSDHVIPEPLAAQQAGADPVNGDSQIGSRYFVDQQVLAQLEGLSIAQGVTPSILGATQTDWWKGRMSASRAKWRVWGNEVSLLRMGLDLRRLASPPFDRKFLINADQWDGYNAARKDLMGHLRANGIGNVVAVTGDIHAFFTGAVLDDYDAPQPVPVATDIVGAGASSTPLFFAFKAAVDADPAFAGLRQLVYATLPDGTIVNTFDTTLRTFNPWIAHADTNAVGYAVVTVTADEVVADLKKFVQAQPGGIVPQPPLAQVTRVTVASGNPVPTVATVCAGAAACASA